MKNTNILLVFTTLLLLLTLSSCNVITGIFNAGVNVGMFAILAILVIIVFVIVRVRKK